MTPEMRRMAALAAVTLTLLSCSSSRKYLDACFAVAPKNEYERADLGAKVQDFATRFSMTAGPPKSFADVYVASDSGISIMLGSRVQTADSSVPVFMVSPARPCKKCSGLASELMSYLSEVYRIGDCSEDLIKELDKAIQN
jgi:hypothetical protein